VTAAVPAVAPAVEMAALVATATATAARMAELVTGGVLTAVPVQAATQWTEELLQAADRTTAVATVGVGTVARSTNLISGRYVSAARWVERASRTSGAQASATAALGRDITGDYVRVGAAWLEGEITRAAARELTVEVRQALKSAPSTRRGVERAAVLDALLPRARREPVVEIARAVRGLRFVLDPDGTTQTALDAFEEQTLSVAVTGPAAHISLWTTAETAAALLTVLDQQVTAWFNDGDLPPEEPVDHDPDTGEARPVRYRRGRLLALAFGETMRGLLDRGMVGSHLGAAAHLSLTVDADRYAAGLGGDLHLPGHDDPIPLGNPTIARIVCDSTITPILTTAARGGCRGTGLHEQLREAARTVLYIGRAQRTVPPRLRRALEVRDGHCAFPDCRVSVSRCHAHHVAEWVADHGPTDLDNLVLLCSRHHHVVHEAGWTLSPNPGADPAASGYWAFAPPRHRP
jgi:hypothetical protein